MGFAFRCDVVLGVFEGKDGRGKVLFFNSEPGFGHVGMVFVGRPKGNWFVPPSMQAMYSPASRSIVNVPGLMILFVQSLFRGMVLHRRVEPSTKRSVSSRYILMMMVAVAGHRFLMLSRATFRLRQLKALLVSMSTAASVSVS